LNRENRWAWLSTVTVLALGLALVVAACGGGTKSPSVAGGTTSVGAKTFADFRIAYDTGIDSLDPSFGYSVESAAILWNVYLPLLGYKHVNGPSGATIVPYLAQSLPMISSDGMTYTLVLRKGLKYSNGAPVKASDFAFAIERDFQIDSPGVGFFQGIVGADTYEKTKKGRLGGIVTNDATGKITIHLTAPQGDFENILASTFAALVPAGTPFKDQSTTPIPSTGPYTIQSYSPNRQVIVVRNPHFDASMFAGNVPAGNPDKITIQIFADAGVALTRTLDGQDDYDFSQPPTDRLGELESKYADQIKVYTPANTFYFFMNTRVAPFNNVKVRQAVNYAINREALARIYGGLATPTENILPPTYAQYVAHHLYSYNPAKARRLIAEAGAKGAPVMVWGSTDEGGRSPEVTAYLQQVLTSIGLDAKLNIVNSAVYWTKVGSQATKAQIGFADWYQDYPHPLDWFDVLLNGERITATHNNNYADFDDAAVNAKIDALKAQSTLTSSVNKQWAALDRQIMQQAPWAPYINRQGIDTFNSDIDLSCYEFHVLYQFDFATICHK